MYTRRNANVMTIEEIWERRYFLDWNYDGLLKRISWEDIQKKHEYGGSFGNFINWCRWTKIGNNLDMSEQFFLDHASDMDLPWMFKRGWKFINIHEDAWRKVAIDLVLKSQKGAGRVICDIINIDRIGLTIGIPHEYQRAGRISFGKKMLSMIAAEKAAGTAWI